MSVQSVSQLYSQLPRAGEVCGIQHVPQDVLLDIFSNLSPKDFGRIEQVCKYWKALSKQVWKRYFGVSKSLGMFKIVFIQQTEIKALKDQVAAVPAAAPE